MDRLREDIAPSVTTLDGLFRWRVAQTPDATAYHQFDAATERWRSWRWSDVAIEVARWCKALEGHGFHAGDRVAIMSSNCVEWAMFDQAALSLGLVTVPLFGGDSVDNCAHILNESGSRLVVVGTTVQFRTVRGAVSALPCVERVVCMAATGSEDETGRVTTLRDWLPEPDSAVVAEASDAGHGDADLATIVYTSGTTGPPKGVMLSHGNILKNVKASYQAVDVTSGDRFVSFLPLSHMFERTAGYYLPMLVGAEVAFARSPMTLLDDFSTFKPTVLISVPRIYEQVLGKIKAKLRHSLVKRLLFQSAVVVGRHRVGNPVCRFAWPLFDRLMASRVRGLFGGCVRYAISGGAPMPPVVERVFLSLGLPVYQGYGLTETSPVLSVNRPGDNVPGSVGLPLSGVEVMIGNDDELLTRSGYVMQGYWERPDATRDAIDESGWFHTGDKARIDARGRLYIVGRIKDIIVMANGEKVSPSDIEQALLEQPLISQVMIYGERRPFLIALVVVATDGSTADARSIKRASAKLLKRFPAYARARRFVLFDEPWSVDNGMLTPTLKLKRGAIVARHRQQIEEAYREGPR